MNNDWIEAANDFAFSYSCFDDRFSVTPQRIDSSWADFCSVFSEPERGRGVLTVEQYHALEEQGQQGKDQRATEKDGPGWSPALYLPGGKRGNSDVTLLSAFVCDFDSGEVDIPLIEDQLGRCAYFIHTTYSHTPEVPKLRAVIPFKAPFPPDQLPRIFDHFADIFNDRLDPCSKKPAQFYYKPSCPPDGEFLYRIGEGTPMLLGQIKEHREARGSYPRRDQRDQPRGNLPRPCKDGERHDVALSAVGKWLHEGRDRDEILYLLRKWNETNHDKWDDKKLVQIVDGMVKTDQKNNPERYDVPWEGCRVASGFQLTHEGVFAKARNEGKDDVLLSGPVWIAARTRDSQKDNWGFLIQWLDDDAVRHEAAIPSQRFHEVSGTVVQDLAAGGLYVIPGKEKLLLQYLVASRSFQRLTSTPQLGWLEGAYGALAYMLPDRVITAHEARTYVFQPERYSPTTTSIRAQGTLASWLQNVLSLLHGNPLLMFGACVGLTGPLLRIARLESGGFHIYGASSRGKTTVAQVAASVMGCGSDPAEAPNRTPIQRWNATLNGLEGLAAAHNDGVLILDELQTCGARDFRKVIYNLAGGRGKVAMTASRTLRPPREWALIFLSTGEISTEQKIEEERSYISPGQRLRMLDISVGDEIVRDTHGRPADEFVTSLKRACSDHFGTLGPAFIEALVGEYKTFDGLQRVVQDELEKATRGMPSGGLAPEAKRAQKRLALVQVAGSLAVDLGLLPIAPSDINESVRFARDCWVDGLGHLSDGIRGMEALKEFLLRVHDRFKDAGHDDRTVAIPDSVGYYDPKEKTYYLLRTALETALRGCDLNTVCRELARCGYLITNEPGRNTYRKQIPQLDQRLRLYAVRSRLLASDPGEWGDQRDRGTQPTDTAA